MRELSEQPIDATVARTLKFETLITPRQQASAKERLMRRAAAQAILPPLEQVEEPPTLRPHAWTLGQRTRQLLDILILDASAYERARRMPRLYEHYNAHGHHAFTIIHMSA